MTEPIEALDEPEGWTIMNTKLFNFFLFTTGAVIGSVVTWKVVKIKYEQIAQEEIDSIREVYSQKSETLNKINAELSDVLKKQKEFDAKKRGNDVFDEEIIRYCNITDELGYTDYSAMNKKKGGDDNMFVPEVIPPDEFGDDLDYETISLTCYSDGVLVDDFGDVIENPGPLVGDDYFDHFGEWEDDSVFVRNDKLKTYYEILLDSRKYSELE